MLILCEQRSSSSIAHTDQRPLSSHRPAQGPVQTWDWTLSGSATTKGKSGKTVEITVLDDIEVNLTVKYGEKSHSRSTKVTIRPRKWKTQLDHQILGYLSGGLNLGAGACLFCLWGKNVCAIGEIDEDSDHILHRENGQNTWDGTGYELVQVEDPGGPLDKQWYVSTASLRVKRAAPVNNHL